MFETVRAHCFTRWTWMNVETCASVYSVCAAFHVTVPPSESLDENDAPEPPLLVTETSGPVERATSAGAVAPAHVTMPVAASAVAADPPSVTLAPNAG